MIIIFFSDSVTSFFPSRLKYAILGTGILGQIVRSSAVFWGRLKRPSPCRIRSAPDRDRVRGLSETSEKCANIFYFGRYTPEPFLDLGICRARTKKHIGKHLFQSWNHFQIDWLLISSPPQFFHGHPLKRLAHCAHRTTDCSAVAFRYRISRLIPFFV